MAPRHQGRGRFTIFVLLLASVTLITLDARGFAPVERLGDALGAVVSPFRGLGDRAFGPVGDAWRGITDVDDLEAENQQLRAEVAELRSREIDDAGAAEELAALRAQLDLRDATQYPTVVAEVVAGSISNFDGFVVEIDRGRADGLRDGMPVLSEGGGLVGRIEDVGQRTARVRLITDPDVSVGALLVGSDEIAIVSGGGEGEPLVVGQGSVPVSVDVAVGDQLVTAGSERSLYPEGIPVGTVIDIVVDEGSLEKQLAVEPVASTQRLRYVTVVLFDPDAPRPESAGDESDAQGTDGGDTTQEDGG